MHDTAILLLEIGAVLLGLGVLGALALRAGISPIPLYLIAGLAFGTGGVLPLATSTDFISAGAELGVVLLLLTLGLEYNADELVTSLRGNARAGLVDLVLNAAPGAICALLLGWGPVAAVAMAGVTYATSSGITAKVLSDLGWIGNRETPTVLSLLVFEDLTMALYLPVLTALLAGLSLLSGALTVAIALATVSVVLLVALRFGRFIEAFVSSPNSEVLLLKVVGLALLVAGLAQQLQVSAAVGAFLVGIALSGQLAHDARALLEPLRDLFAAVFFVFFGFQTDPGKILPVAGLAALLAVVSMATKLLTGMYAARRAGIARAGQARAGIALIPRGEFNIVIAGLAVAAGVHPDLGPLAAAYVLILAAFGPLAAKLVQPLITSLTRRAAGETA
ncbi:cation:proton antiporter [Nonomuraea roseoviolacea subsp. roseoviolacea]|uniref:Cation:proton antiporter n=2 Tax=Nonomuraea TaxID=83681 RepID=A0A7Y6M561_9ACTN|nr:MULTISPECIES: cation:proton antiporter [Nonomuraea]MCP2352464.1 CPA2 family monovalent cation:H+ antiporter-2 [Nonomuraea roseoviolacea subsp. carminata]NUW34291.1 cation:proton antiporter [Nonomuraea montanisoli]